MNSLFFDTIVAFFAFAIIRYTLPNYLLSKELSLLKCIVVSACYALSVLVSNHLSTVYKQNQVKQVDKQ